MDINSVLVPIEGHGVILTYAILFLLKCIEGPVISYFAAFASYLGFLNIWIVLILSVLGGIIPDTLLFVIGKFVRGKKSEKIASYFGLNKKRISWIEKNIKNHSIKILFIVKHLPPLPIPGIILCGFMKMDFLKFFIASSLFSIFGSLIFVGLGYFSAMFTINILQYLKMSEYLLPIIIILVIAVYFLSKLFYKHLANFIKNGSKHD